MTDVAQKVLEVLDRAVSGLNAKFLTARGAHEAIRERCAILGVPVGKLPYNLKRANQVIAELDAMIEKRAPAPAANLTNIAVEVAAIKAQPVAVKPAAKPIVSAPVTPKPAAVQTVAQPTDAHVRDIARILGVESNRDAVTEALFRQHIQLDWMPSEAELVKRGLKRLDRSQVAHGFRGAVRSFQVENIRKLTTKTKGQK